MLQKILFRVGNKTIYFLGGFGLALVCVVCFVGFKAMPDIVDDKIWQMKVLKQDSEQWKMFLKIPFPFTFKVYMFNVENPEEVLEGGKPVVKEVGPYVYKVYKWNSGIEWSPSLDEISYFAYTRYEFDKSQSGIYSDEDMVTTLNTAFWSIILKTEETQSDALQMVEPVLPAVFGGNDGIFLKARVKDILFDGLPICENGGQSGGFVAGLVCQKILEQIPAAKTMRLVNGTIYFSNLHHKNNTHQGRLTIKSGLGKKAETGWLKLYNNESYLSNWPDENSTCNRIRGVTSIFPTRIQKDMVFESFSADICRHMALSYEKEETVKSILGYRFSGRNDSFSYSKKSNICFCVNKTENVDVRNGCLKDGLMDLTTCTGGPVMLSFPHLLYADKEYLNSLVGLHPNKSEHETFVVLEPISGFPLKLAQRVQFNMFVKPVQGISFLQNLTNALVPMMWIEESVTLDDEHINMLQNNLFRTLNIVNIVKWVGIGIGSACAIFAIFMFVYNQAP